MSRYDLTPDDLMVLRDNSPLAKFFTTGEPLAFMRGPFAHGNNVMRVPKDQRPAGWMMHDVSVVGSRKSGTDIPLVPECTGDDNIPDWAIAKAVRQMATAEPAQVAAGDQIIERARAILQTMPGQRFKP